jgi:hypothetical protein
LAHARGDAETIVREDYLARLEALHREWGSLAYGPALERPASAEARCAGAGRDVTKAAVASSWTEAIVSTVRALTAGQPTFSILEIGAPGFSVTRRLRTEFPDAASYVTCRQGSSCPIHGFEDDTNVRVYAVDPRQIFGIVPGGNPKVRTQIVDVVVLLDPTILSPRRRSCDGERYVPELAAYWLNTCAGYYFVAVNEATSPFDTAEGTRARRVATAMGDLVLLCGSGTRPVPEPPRGERKNAAAPPAASETDA